MPLQTQPRKLVFSRKGFDSGSGGAPSPIVDGRPISLPIPASGWPSETTYRALGLTRYVDAAVRNPEKRDLFCHHDPYFEGGRVAFGQESAAQGHLTNQQIACGDVFLFFGLFSGDGHKPHHRIFGFMQIEEILRPGTDETPGWLTKHPLFLLKSANGVNPWKPNNTVYVGCGGMAQKALPNLRLTAPDSDSVSLWSVPEWLCQGNLSYHANAHRWLQPGRLRTVGRGQEFVSNIENNCAAQTWLTERICEIES